MFYAFESLIKRSFVRTKGFQQSKIQSLFYDDQT